MDRKSLIILIVCAALFAIWLKLTPRMMSPGPAATNQVTMAVTNEMPASSNSAALVPAPATNLAAAVTPPNAPEELLVVTNEAIRYTFTSYGGGLKQVELLNYPESVACGAKRGLASNRVATLNGPASRPVLSLLNAESLQGDGVFKLTRFSRSEPASPSATNQARMIEGVRAEKTVGTAHLLREFEFGSNYLLRARFRIENHSSQPLAVPAQQWVVGSATPTNPHDEETDVGFHWHDGNKSASKSKAYFDNKTLGCFPGAPITNFSTAAPRLTWATANNQFFFLALMPTEPAQEIAAVRYPWPPPSPEELAADPTAFTNQVAFLVSLHHAATNVPPNQALERQFHLFAGPREYRTLQRIGGRFKNGLDDAMGFSGWAIFNVFSGMLLLAMNGLHGWGLSYAWAIITITVIIKLLFWPLTQASTRSMKRMQALQPQIKALQEKYKDDPKKQQEKMMEFWREHKINPMGGCLPMLLQVPVFIGFFQMVRTAIELRGATFLWACDLTRPDTVLVIPGINFPINPLPLLMGVTMFWQARIQPMSPGMDPVQQKIMKYFPLIFLVILYNYSAGLTLYWTVQNLLTIAQMKLTKAKDDAAAAQSAAKPGAKPPVAPPPKAPAKPAPRKNK